MGTNNIERDCEDCGDEIPVGRLKARPTATKCVHCQDKAERNGQFSKHRMDYIVKPNGGNEVEVMETFLVRGTV